MYDPTHRYGDPANRYGGGFVFSTFNDTVQDAGVISAISPDGKNFRELAGRGLNSSQGFPSEPTGGLNGVEILALGPGAAFGSDLYVPTIGLNGLHGDGNLFIMSPDGKATPFIIHIDATSVAFDTDGILGGGMFVGDFNENLGAGKIWRIMPKFGMPEQQLATLTHR